MSTPSRRARRRAKGLPNWRIVRYADDFVILVHGTGDDVHTLHDEIATALEPLGLRLSPAKTQIVHMSESFDFLGFRIQWRRKRGTSKWYVYTFIADRPVRSLKDKVPYQQVVATATQGRADPAQPDHARMGELLQARGLQTHTGQPGELRMAPGDQLVDAAAPLDVERRAPPTHRPDGRWRRPAADGIELFNIASVPVTRYCYRGIKIPNPLDSAQPPQPAAKMTPAGPRRLRLPTTPPRHPSYLAKTIPTRPRTPQRRKPTPAPRHPALKKAQVKTPTR